MPLGGFPSGSWVMGFIIGAVVGSFLNMLIYRLPRHLSFSNPPKSFCPKCKHSLGVVDLIPLLSWLSTGGKCRYCKDPIAPRYFFVELLTGSLFGGLWYQFLVVSFEPIRMIGLMIGAACLVAIIYIDWELYIIPDEINFALLIVGIGLNVALHTPEIALEGAFTGWAILWGIAFFGRIGFRKDAMGHGDIKMMRGVGAILGPGLVIANMGVAVIVGLIGGILTIVLTRRHPEPEPEVDDDDAPYEPESIVSLLKYGLFYLLCLDCIGVFWTGIYRVIGETYVDESVEDDTWKPSLTTIPFGPYLAVGALACMLFEPRIQGALDNYWDMSAHPAQTANGPNNLPNFVEMGQNCRLTNHSAENRRSKDRLIICEMARMNWNKIEPNLVQPDGESGAKYA